VVCVLGLSADSKLLLNKSWLVCAEICLTFAKL
jgi:hypothetical protein